MANLYFENAHIWGLNFSGQNDPFKTGRLGFNISIEDEEEARRLEADGLNVKWPKPRADIDPEEDYRKPFLAVKVRFDLYPPKVVLISNGNNTLLDGTNAGMLDSAMFEKVDLVLNTSAYKASGTIPAGISVYLKSGYFTLESDRFTDKYGI